LFMRYLYLSLVVLLFVTAGRTPYKKIVITGRAQGTTYSVIYYAHDSTVTAHQLDSIFRAIDRSLSLYQPGSLINRFNNARREVKADHHLQKVVRKAMETFHETDGIFDITVQPLVQAWGFGVKRTDKLPDSAQLQSIKQCVSTQWLHWKGNRLRKAKPCVKIDLNGIAQGYTVDVLADFLEQNGIHHYLVEVGGEIRVKGKKMPGNEPMKIGIEAPPASIFEATSLQQVLTLDSGAITTSGSYRKYYESEGQKITHLIDPRTGFPAQNELISVTVYARDAMTADAYDNALMVMGLEKALQFVEARNDMAAYFIYRKPDGLVADTACRQFHMLLQR